MGCVFYVHILKVLHTKSTYHFHCLLLKDEEGQRTHHKFFFKTLTEATFSDRETVAVDTEELIVANLMWWIADEL